MMLVDDNVWQGALVALAAAAVVAYKSLPRAPQQKQPLSCSCRAQLNTLATTSATLPSSVLPAKTNIIKFHFPQ